MPPVTIVTGADDRHMPYLLGLLHALRRHDDLGCPLRVLDFGLSAESRARLAASRPGLEVLPIGRIDQDIAAMRAVPGVDRAYRLAHGLNTMRKLAMAEHALGDFALWLDADTLVLRPLSSWLPAPRPRALYAGRNSHQPQPFQFTDPNPLLRQALSDHLLAAFGIATPTRNAFNSGVLLTDTAYYAELVQWARERFLLPYAPYMLGDQAVLNTAMNLRGETALPLPGHVNLAIAAPDAPLELVWTGEPAFLAPLVKGQVPAVYHYLHVKPLTHPDREHPVVRLFEWWHNAE